MVSKSGGAFLRPQTATRMGWNMGPAFRPSVAAACAQRLVQRIVVERGCGQNLLRSAARIAAGRIAGDRLFCGNQLGRIVGRKLVDEEKVGGGDGIAQAA